MLGGTGSATPAPTSATRRALRPWSANSGAISGLRDPALHAHARRQRPEVGGVAELTGRHQHREREVGECLERLAVDARVERRASRHRPEGDVHELGLRLPDRRVVAEVVRDRAVVETRRREASSGEARIAATGSATLAAKLVRLTAKGRTTYPVARAAIADVEARWQERIGEPKLRRLRETLEELAPGG